MIKKLIHSIIGHKVTFMARGKSFVMNLTDHDLLNLRLSSNNWVGDDYREKKHGFIYNFAIYSLFDYMFDKKENRNKFKAIFPYNEYNEIYWTLS